MAKIASTGPNIVDESLGGVATSVAGPGGFVGVGVGAADGGVDGAADALADGAADALADGAADALADGLGDGAAASSKSQVVVASSIVSETPSTYEVVAPVPVPTATWRPMTRAFGYCVLNAAKVHGVAWMQNDPV